MAGWIKMRKELPDEPEVQIIAERLGMDADHVCGKLFRLWSWADTHALGEDVDGLSLAWIDRKLGVPGFGAAMAEAGWIEPTEKGFRLVDFGKHNWNEGKGRAQAQARKEAQRGRRADAPGHAGVTRMSRAERDASVTDVTHRSRTGHGDVTGPSQAGNGQVAPSGARGEGDSTDAGRSGAADGLGVASRTERPAQDVGMSRAERDAGGTRAGPERDLPIPGPVPTGGNPPTPFHETGREDAATASVLSRPDPARCLPSDFPHLAPVADAVVEAYQAAIQPAQTKGGGRGAVVALLSRNVPETDLRRSIEGYLAFCIEDDRPRKLRYSVRVFFAEGHWEEFRAGKREKPAAQARPRFRTSEPPEEDRS